MSETYRFGRRRLWAERNPWGYEVEFIFFERQGDGIAHSTNMNMYMPSNEEGGQRLESTFSLNQEETQELIDNLWRLGFRPSEGTGSAGALAATQRHLEDMRKLVFEKENGEVE